MSSTAKVIGPKPDQQHDVQSFRQQRMAEVRSSLARAEAAQADLQNESAESMLDHIACNYLRDEPDVTTYTEAFAMALDRHPDLADRYYAEVNPSAAAFVEAFGRVVKVSSKG